MLEMSNSEYKAQLIDFLRERKHKTLWPGEFIFQPKFKESTFGFEKIRETGHESDVLQSPGLPIFPTSFVNYICCNISL